MSDKESPQKVQRSKVTYGRRKTDEGDGETGTVALNSMLAEYDAPDKDSDDDVSQAGDVKHMFSWKQDLLAVDDSTDEENNNIRAPAREEKKSTSSLSFGPSDLFTTEATPAPRLAASSSRDRLDEDSMEYSFNTDLTRETVASQETLTTPPTSSPDPAANSPAKSADSPSSITRVKRKSKSKSAEKQGKAKPLTKKEKEEMAKETARIQADRAVNFEKDDHRNLSMQNFFHKLGGARLKVQSSDPILSGGETTSPVTAGLMNQHSMILDTSPIRKSPPAVPAFMRREVSKPKMRTPSPKRASLYDDSDDELDAGFNLVAAFQKTRELAERSEKLQAVKQTALRAKSLPQEDSDDDLEIEREVRSVGTRPKKLEQPGFRHKQLPILANKKSRQPDPQRQLLEKSRQQAKALDSKRLEQWQSKGGDRTSNKKSEEKVDLQEIIEIGAREEEVATDEEGSDDDYQEEGSEHEPSGADAEEQSGVTPSPTRSISQGGGSGQETDKENIAPAPFIASPISHHNFSDDADAGRENDENARPLPSRSLNFLLPPLSFGEPDEEQENRPVRKHRAVVDSSDEELDRPGGNKKALSTSKIVWSQQPGGSGDFADTPGASTSAFPSALGPPLELQSNAANAFGGLNAGDPGATDDFDGMGFSQIFADDQPLHDALNNKEMNVSLTQNEDRVLPYVEMSATARREEDELFLEDAEEKRKQNDEELRPKGPSTYMNIHGFLTQTKPPELSQRTFDLSQRFFGPDGSSVNSPALPAGSQRQPLGTLSLSPMTISEDDSIGIMHRLRRRSPSPELQRLNAFDVMIDRAKKQGEGREKSRQKNKASKDVAALIMDEAEESDEEAQFGFGNSTFDQGEEDDGDPNAVVEGLVDDATMDVDVENSEKVVEKYKEQEAEADAAHEKVVQEIVDGKRRAKRRDRGIGLSDSESEDSDPDNRRRIYSKKRKLENDDLEDLAKNPETKPFHREYMRAIDDDDNAEFGYLDKENDGPLAAGDDDESADEMERLSEDEAESDNSDLDVPVRLEHAEKMPEVFDDGMLGLGFDEEDLSSARYQEVQRSKQSSGQEERNLSKFKKDHQQRNLQWAKEEKQMTKGGSGSGRSATVVARKSDKASNVKGSSMSTRKAPSAAKSTAGSRRSNILEVISKPRAFE